MKLFKDQYHTLNLQEKELLKKENSKAKERYTIKMEISIKEIFKMESKMALDF